MFNKKFQILWFIFVALAAFVSMNLIKSFVGLEFSYIFAFVIFCILVSTFIFKK
jgi:hypothetical protein